MKKQFIATTIIILFIGVAVAPSINQSVVTASQDDDLVEVTTELCGLTGIKPQIVKLNRQQISEIDAIMQKLEARFSQSRTIDEKVDIYNQAIELFSKYRLIGNVKVEYLKTFFTCCIKIQEQFAKYINKVKKTPNKVGDKRFENICCLVFSSASTSIDEIKYLSSPMRTYFYYLIQKNILLYASSSKILHYLGFVLWLLVFLQKMFCIVFPIALNSWTIIEGWYTHVDSIGLYEIKQQSLQGTCVDLVGFSGIKIQYNVVPAGSAFLDGYLIGFAVAISKTKELYSDIF